MFRDGRDNEHLQIQSFAIHFYFYEALSHYIFFTEGLKECTTQINLTPAFYLCLRNNSFALC